jgi:hypothetical protein
MRAGCFTNRTLDVRRDVLSMLLTDEEKDRLELWLLDVARDSYIPIRFLIAQREGIVAWLNRAPPGEWLPQMPVAALGHLLRSGQIEVFRYVETADGESEVVMADEALLADLKESPEPWRQRHLPWRERDLLYRMTATGAERWEDFFQPDWSRYWSQSHEHVDDDGVTTRIRYECGSNATRMSVLGRCVECLDTDLAFGLRDIVLSEVAPWQATYWKSLPRGQFVSVTYRERMPIWSDPDRWCDACSRLYDWRRSIDGSASA